MKLSLILCFIVLAITGEVYSQKYYRYQQNYNYEGQSQNELDEYDTNEWDRYLEKQKELNKKNKWKDINNERKKYYTNSEQVAPEFKMSRTKTGYVVKQLEPGSSSKGKGGFQFSVDSAPETSVKYKFDGNVAPVMKISETRYGAVGKTLEYGSSKNVGADWAKRKGSIDLINMIETGSKSGRSMNMPGSKLIIDNQGRVAVVTSVGGYLVKNQEIPVDQGVNPDIPDGCIAKKGLTKLKLNKLNASFDIVPMDPMDSKNTQVNDYSSVYGNGNTVDSNDDVSNDDESNYGDDSNYGNENSGNYGDDSYYGNDNNGNNGDDSYYGNDNSVNYGDNSDNSYGYSSNDNYDNNDYDSNNSNNNDYDDNYNSSGDSSYGYDDNTNYSNTDSSYDEIIF